MNFQQIFLLLVLSCCFTFSCREKPVELHVYELHEIVLTAEETYENPYTQVALWVELEGPGFSGKVSGFWNGGNEFRVRMVATQPGVWKWKSYSNQNDQGLRDQSGSFRAVEWSETEKTENPNRLGFVKATGNGRALQYADGTPFFMLGDTWWAASTWRFPLKGIEPALDYVPQEGISFEEAVAFRKKQGYNTIAMIAAFPNWATDDFPAQYYNEDSIGIRQAWEKNGINTAKDMHDEEGNRPFERWEKSEIIADFDRLNPDYFKSLDKKMQYLQDQGFVTFLETVRRDHGPSWKKYFDWPESFARYVQYIVARYGAYNIIFSGIHLDWINEDFSLTADDYNEVLTYHYHKYRGLPYGQPHTILIDGSTYERFGHGKEAPWLTMHAVGNFPRNHGFYPMIEELFALEPPYPVANLEPYYPGWNHGFHNMVAGELPQPDSERDNYFGRAQMYGSVLSGGLAGHMYGTGAYDGNTTGESKTEGERPYVWEALNYESGAQMQHLGTFMLSEGKKYRNCKPRKELLEPFKTPGAPEKGLDGWAFLLIAPKNDLAFLYFEIESDLPVVKELMPEKNYEILWFDPTEGQWLESYTLATGTDGTLQLDAFPEGGQRSARDWALKIKLTQP